MKRYPGLKPFTAQEQNIFFGRSEDSEKLLQFIRLEQIVVLYSKSGLGKSSLLNAGVIPQIKEQNYAQPFTVRIGSYSDADKLQLSPVQKLISELNIPQKTENEFVLDKLIPNESSLWYNLKLMQSKNKDNKLPYLIVFDQFEELFTYPKPQVDEFCEQLANILRVSIPANFSKKLQETLKTDRNLIPKEEIAFINRALQIKVVFAIRSDRMSLLNEMTTFIPYVLHNCFELKPLSIEQAKDAITLPANISSTDFSTPVFGFEESALDKILNALKDDKQNIESFQLQIICQYCENLIDERLKTNKNQQFSILQNDISDIKNILETFYTKLIDNLKYHNEHEKKNVYKVLGEDFIFEKEQRRILVYEGRAEERLGKSLLKQLTDSFILRSEKNSTGGFVYELSHDTLVAPILKAFRILRDEEIRLENERKQKEKIRRQRTIITIVSVAAVISVVLGIFAVIKMNQANDLLKQVQEKQAQIEENTKKEKKLKYERYSSDAIAAQNSGSYEKAVDLWQIVKEFTDDTISINSKIDSCKIFALQETEYNDLIDKANNQIDNNNFVEAVNLLEKAILIGSKEKVTNILKDIKTEIETQIYSCQSLLDAAQQAGDQKGVQEQKVNLSKLNTLKNRIVGLLE